MQLNIRNETSQLKSVVLGQPHGMGDLPSLNHCYDAKSYESVQRLQYPTEANIVDEMSAFEKVLHRYDVEVLRPWTLENCNQVFARDVAIVIDDKIINSNIIPDREDEKEAYQGIYDKIAYNKIFNLPEKAHVEGGDVVACNDTVFVGLYTAHNYASYKTARTNQYAFDFLKELCPDKQFVGLELCKHDTDPRKGILHLDCCFMPVGEGKAIVYPQGFIHKKDYDLIVSFFGKENVFEITNEEMYFMNSNIFSISPTVVVSEQNFHRLNNHLEQAWSIHVERIPYFEISKMGGLLRCSTLPLVREN